MSNLSDLRCPRGAGRSKPKTLLPARCDRWETPVTKKKQIDAIGQRKTTLFICNFLECGVFPWKTPWFWLRSIRTSRILMASEFQESPNAGGVLTKQLRGRGEETVSRSGATSAPPDLGEVRMGKWTRTSGEKHRRNSLKVVMVQYISLNHHSIFMIFDDIWWYLMIFGYIIYPHYSLWMFMAYPIYMI